MDWDADQLKARIRAILTQRANEAPNVKAFGMDVAEAAGSSVSAVRKWRDGEVLPDATALLNLFENLPGFEAEIRGDRNGKKAEREADAELGRKVREMFEERGNVHIINEGKVS